MQKRSIRTYKCLKMRALLLVVRSTLFKEHGSLNYHYKNDLYESSNFFKGGSKYNPPLQIVFACHPHLEIVFYPPLKTVFVVVYIQN